MLSKLVKRFFINCNTRFNGRGPIGRSRRGESSIREHDGIHHRLSFRSWYSPRKSR